MRTMPSFRVMHSLVPLLVMATVLLAACAPGRATATPSPAAGATPNAIDAAATLSAMSTGPQTGRPADDFTLEAIDGSDVTLSALRGKAVVVAFWATWCEYCREELPLIADLYAEAHDDGLEVLAVNLHDEPEQVVAFVAELGLPYPVLMDRRGEVANRYRVRGLPTTVFIDPEGAVQRVHLGTIEESTLRDYVNSLLAKES